MDTVPADEGIEASAVAGMESIDAATWDALLVPGQAPLRHSYLRAWQQAELPGLVYRPLVARDFGGRLKAGAPGYFYDLDMALVHNHLAPGAVRRVRRLLPRALVSRVFEMGSATPLVPPFVCSRGPDAERCIRSLIQAAIDESEAGGADMLIVQNFHEPDPFHVEAAALEELGFVSVPIPPTVVLRLPFETFEEYLGSMRSAYRRRARGTLAASRHLSVEHLPSFAQHVPELARLWRLVYERAHEVKREILGERFFARVASLDELSVLALRRADGSLASYALLLEDGPHLHFLYTGFEARAGREEGAYFRLLYEIVRHAIETGRSTVNLGITTLQPKLDLGGVPVPLHAWLRHRRPLRQRVFAGLARGPLAPRLPAPRHVFKD